MTSHLAIALLAALCAADTRPAVPAHARSSAPHAVRLADPELERVIRARFARSKINVNHFSVRVQGGVATIEGKTEVIQHKGTATRLAKLAGASAVNNRIEVSQAARDRANANLAKGRRRAQVQRDGRGTVRTAR